jgi:hypothetical protein
VLLQQGRGGWRCRRHMGHGALGVAAAPAIRQRRRISAGRRR